MIPLNKPLDIADFADADFVALLREIFPHELSRFGPGWPGGREYRKDWEVGMSVLALRQGGVLRPDARILGVGAGHEPTIFFLTTQVGEVHATDLYLPEPPVREEPALRLRLRTLVRAAMDVIRAPRSLPQPPGTWGDSASARMFVDPGRYWPGAWNPRRLVAQHMDGLDLRYESDTFDGIFSSGSIEHFGGHAEVRRAVREMARVLKPGGVLTVSTEYRLDGPGPGLPGILMFDEAELLEHIVDASGLVPMDRFDPRHPPAVAASAQPLSEMSENVRAHVAEHGEILYDKLTWPEYPAVALRHGERIWTSCHLALRKPVREPPHGTVPDEPGSVTADAIKP